MEPKRWRDDMDIKDAPIEELWKLKDCLTLRTIQDNINMAKVFWDRLQQPTGLTNGERAKLVSAIEDLMTIARRSVHITHHQWLQDFYSYSCYVNRYAVGAFRTEKEWAENFSGLDAEKEKLRAKLGNIANEVMMQMIARFLTQDVVSVVRLDVVEDPFGDEDEAAETMYH
jgi:hypothetical protein